MPILNPGLNAVDASLSREVLELESSSIPQYNSDQVQFSLASTQGLVYRVAIDGSCRLRIYATAQSRQADLNRSLLVRPRMGEGLLLEVLTTPNQQAIDLFPVVWLVGSEFYVTLTNNQSNTRSFLITLNYLKG